MKKALITALVALSILPIGLSVTASPGANYGPVIEACITQNFPYPNERIWVVACIPGGNQTCQANWCAGVIL